MSQYLLIERIQVQNANAASGFTWGFPAITHFLGFSHNLNRKMQQEDDFNQLALTGCAVIAHQQHIKSYKDGSINRFSQNKANHYLSNSTPANLRKTPPINEEAKMNMTVSLLIPVEGYLGNLAENLAHFIKNACQTQRLAGGTILSIEDVKLIDLAKEIQLTEMRRKLLPAFILQDRSNYLAEHFAQLQEINPEAELLDAWFDFIALKQVARPECRLIDKYLADLAKETEELAELNEIWLEHKNLPYSAASIPDELINYFAEQEVNQRLNEQWESYLSPTAKTNANWEYIKKPQSGYLVPLMTGYKAISEIFPAGEIEGARDIETQVTFTEAVHSVGEWQSLHRLKTFAAWEASVWQYTYSKGWYLCQQEAAINALAAQNSEDLDNLDEEEFMQNDDDFY